MPVILTHPVIIKDRFHFHSVSNYGLTDEYNEVISRAAIEASSSVALKTASRNMPISLPRFLLCVTLSAICAQSFPGRLVDSSAGTESMADLVSSYFSECLVHIIEQSGEVDMDYGALQRPLMLHRLQKYRNPDEVQAIVAYIKRKGRLLRRGDSFRKFRCLVALVSTSDEDARTTPTLGNLTPCLQFWIRATYLVGFQKSNVKCLRIFCFFIHGPILLPTPINSEMTFSVT